MHAMLSALPLALRQLADRQTFALLLRSLLLTLLIFAVLGGLLWWAVEAWLVPLAGAWGEDGAWAARVGAFVTMMLVFWVLFRALAMAVMGVFGDAIVESVEADHYPAAAAAAVPVGKARGLALGMRSALRALGWNLLASPIYVLLLFTGIGLPIALTLVNALLLGRDLETMVLARHPGLPPLDAGTRYALGLGAALAFLVPVVNLLAPVFGAALAVHMVHRRTEAA